MSPSRFFSTLGGRRVILAFGGIYIALALGWTFTQVGRSTSFGELIIFVLIVGPGVVIFYAGYWLPRSDIRDEFYPAVARWCLGGFGMMVAVLAFYSLQPNERVDDISTILILTSLASVAGLAAGIYNAHAKTRARELEETVEQLKTVNEQLETSNERLEQFAYAASHDLQEPLRMVSSYLQLVENRYRDDLDEDGREFIDFAVGGADRMQAMIESLLKYSRINTRGEPLKPTDAEAILESVFDDLQLWIEETDATITSDELPTVTADADQLAQLFRHLLSNALKYSGDESPKVHVGVERTDEHWRFSVVDEGIGIDPDFHERIFTVFENLHAGKEESEKGAGGIGLALCERIIERHGGDIWVESTLDEGATFYFTIPAAPENQSDPLAAFSSSE